MGFDSEQTRDGAALFVDFAPVCNSRNTDEPYRIIDDVHHAPVTDPNAPQIFITRGSTLSEFFPRWRLYLDGVLIQRRRPLLARSDLIF